MEYLTFHGPHGGKGVLKISDKIVDMFKAGVKAQNWSFGRPPGCRAVFFGVDMNTKAFKAAPREAHAKMPERIEE